MRSLIALTGLVLLLSFETPVTGVSNGCIGPEEQRLYDLIMKYRQSKRLPKIPLSGRLTQVAQLHAQDLAENYEYGNTQCNLHSWSDKGSWIACCYTTNHSEPTCMWNKPKEISEYGGPGYEIAYYHSGGAAAEAALNIWKSSPGHNNVIVNQGNWKNLTWKAVGIGVHKQYAVVWFGEAEDDLKTSPCK